MFGRILLEVVVFLICLSVVDSLSISDISLYKPFIIWCCLWRSRWFKIHHALPKYLNYHRKSASKVIILYNISICQSLLSLDSCWRIVEQLIDKVVALFSVTNFKFQDSFINNCYHILHHILCISTSKREVKCYWVAENKFSGLSNFFQSKTRKKEKKHTKRGKYSKKGVTSM